jgi:hypothetical protein
MGYYSRMRGQIVISPPLSWSELQQVSDFLPGVPESKERLIRIELSTRHEETDQGTLTIKTGVSVVPTWDDEIKAYSIEKDMKDLFGSTVFEGHRLTGHILVLGEEQGDVTRFDGTGVGEKAELRCPDGSKVEGAEL